MLTIPITNNNSEMQGNLMPKVKPAEKNDFFATVMENSQIQKNPAAAKRRNAKSDNDLGPTLEENMKKQIEENILAAAQAAQEQEKIVTSDAQDVSQEPVISILEGNSKSKDMMLSELETGLSEDMARMPQTGSLEMKSNQSQLEELYAQEENKQNATMVSGDDPCPLENENDNAVSSKGKTDKDDAMLGTKDVQEQEQARSMPIAQMVDITPEKIASAQKMDAQMEMAPPVSSDNLFEALVEKMEMSQSAGSDQLEIQLKPEHLGKVSIQLSLGDHGLQAKITADNMGIRNMIGGQITQLIESLAEKGIRVSQVDVVYTGVSSDQSFSKQSQSGREAPRQGRSSGEMRLDASGELYTVPDWEWNQGISHVVDTTISSVEYRA